MVVPSNNRQSEYGQSEDPQSPSDLRNDPIIQQDQTVQNLAEDVAELRGQAEAAKSLKQRVNWLTALLAASLLILGGGLIGTTLSLRERQADLRSAQGELADQLQVAAEAQSDVQSEAQSLNRISEQLQTLNQQAQDLTEQAQNLTTEIPEVSATQWADLQQRLRALEQSIQDGISGETAGDQMGEQLNGVQEILQDFREMLSSLNPTGDSTGDATTDGSTETPPAEPSRTN